MSGLQDCALAHDAAVAQNGKSFLNDEFMRVIGAHDDRALDAAIRGFTAALGFDRYSVCVIHDDLSSEDSCLTVSMLHNTPPEYFGEWIACEAGRVDPVMQHCKRSSAPIVYGQDTYVRAGAAEKWEHQAPFGFGYGVGSVLHLPQHRHVFFGVDRRSPIRVSRSELTELVARVHLFGTFVQCAALSVLDTRPEVQSKPASPIRLSRREHECLSWAAEGKTAWETGMLLSIAEGSVAKVLAAAIRKLGCVTKPQAVVKALRLGLIS